MKAFWNFNDPDLPNNTLAYHEADNEYKMLVKQGDKICTVTTNDEGKKMVMTGVYHGRENWIVCYKEAEQ